ncbi:Linoleate 9S-lipoxygenase [Spatholobus suberectus]|nr:Linoleate 9S-lipoxygenase [Spatholobus suberectus]
MTDEEFAREMIAGVNPHIIRRLQEFPPKSKLDSHLYGDNTSTITKEHLEPNMGGITVVQAIQSNRLFILDHHDTIFPYLRRINATDTKAYATRTILFLQDNGTLKPLAIELSKPHPQGDNFVPVGNVYLPANQGVEASIWLLAKAYVKLIQRNNDETLRNRYGPVKMPYTLLYPSSEEGLTCRGIPNSISI